MDLRKPLKMAGNALLGILDPEKDFMPIGGYETAHDLGRWWDAVLRLEETMAFVIPADLEAASLRNLRLFTANPDGLLMDSQEVPWLQKHAKINPHNFREALLAFGTLVRRRRSAWACQAGLKLARTMDRCLQTDGSFDFTKLQCWGHVPLTTDPSHTELKRNGWFDGTATSGRSLEALVWLFESTGQPLFLEVAQRIAEHHLEYSTSPDGTVREEIISPDNVGHNHSYHGTLRGLLLFGLLTQQSRYVDVVDATYRNGIRGGIVKKSGWTPHDLGKMRFANEHGDPSADPASAGDAAQLALWLALDVGGHDLLDDVERYVRARLLPSQITEDDKRRWPQSQITDRQIGVWGCHGACHAEKGRHPDVLASITHSLCDIYAHICTQTKAAIRVNLHFDYEDSKLKITSTRNQRAKLSVLVKQPGNIMIRVPQWAPQESVHLTIDAKDLPLKRLGHFAWISRDIVSENAEIVMSYDLPEQLTQEQMPSGKCYKFKWRGDEIVGVDPQDDNPLPFYPAMENDPK